MIITSHDATIGAAAPGSARRAAGILRLLAALAVFSTIVIQISDRVINNAFDPSEYFSYFTIESVLINIVVLSVGGAYALRTQRDTALLTAIRLSTVAFAVVTAGVYNLLLRNVPYEGFVGLQWPNEVLHVWIPLFIVLDWFLSPGKPALPWKAAWAVLVFPVAWISYTLIRGAFTDIYPYPFLDPTTGGELSVVMYVVALTGFMVAISFGLVASTRKSRATGG